MERALREFVRKRAGGRCEYCQMSEEYLVLPFTIDHIIAEKHHGQTRASNLCFACFACNNHKGTNISGIDENTKIIVSLYNPRRHKWTKHFRWAGPILVGLTPAGRATVAVLEINLEYRVDLRQGLIDAGLFPPT
jgi:hypothetical protein